MAVRFSPVLYRLESEAGATEEAPACLFEGKYRLVTGWVCCSIVSFISCIGKSLSTDADRIQRTHAWTLIISFSFRWCPFLIVCMAYLVTE